MCDVEVYLAREVLNSNCLPENARDASRNAEDLLVLDVLFLCIIISSVFAFVNQF